jgi:hypothetical protein
MDVDPEIMRRFMAKVNKHGVVSLIDDKLVWGWKAREEALKKLREVEVIDIPSTAEVRDAVRCRAAALEAEVARLRAMGLKLLEEYQQYVDGSAGEVGLRGEAWNRSAEEFARRKAEWEKQP